MCKGVVNVYACRHREVGQIHMCERAWQSNQSIGCWSSVVYLLTGTEPRRQCRKTTSERRYLGKPCWSCSAGLTQPVQPLPLSRSAPSRSPVRPSRPYQSEPMMAMSSLGPPSSASAPLSPSRAVSSQCLPPPAAYLAPASAPLPTIALPSSAPAPRSARPSGTGNRTHPRNPSSSARPSRPPGLSPPKRPLRHTPPPPSRNRMVGTPALSPPSCPPTGIPAARLSSQPRPRPSPATPTSSRLRPSTSSSLPDRLRHKRTTSFLADAASPNHPSSHAASFSRITTALRAPKSAESFACVEARRVERGEPRPSKP